MQVRNWIYVEDFGAAIDLVLERGQAGQAYNVGGPERAAKSSGELVLEQPAATSR